MIMALLIVGAWLALLLLVLRMLHATTGMQRRAAATPLTLVDHAALRATEPTPLSVASRGI